MTFCSNSKLIKNFTLLSHETSNIVKRLLVIVGFRLSLNSVKPHTVIMKEESNMTDRQQAYYDYLEQKEHNRRTEQEQKRHDQEVERLTAENQAEQARAHQASEGIQREANAIQREYNAASVAVAQQNANTNRQNADTNARNADINQQNADTTYKRAMNDYLLGAKNASTNAYQVRVNDANKRKELQLTSDRDYNNFQAKTRELDQAQGRLDLAWKEYQVNKNDKTWNNVLKSVNTFNSTADTWASILGLKAPTTSIRLTESGSGPRGKITLKDITKISKNLLR